MPNLPTEYVWKGEQRSIAYAVDANGNMPAKDFLESDEPSDRQKAGFLRVFQVLAATGRVVNVEHFKRESGPIWAFKSHHARIAAFQIGPTWYLTHGFIKKQPKWPREELKRAERIYGEHMQRIEGHR